MVYVFRVCFFTGTLFTLVSFLLGQLFDFADIDGDPDFDGDFPGLTVSPLKPIVLAALVTSFGGIGLMTLQAGLFGYAALGAAGAGGLLIAAAIYRLVVVPLYGAQNTSSVSHRDLTEQPAMVSLRIKDGGFGSITYVVNGNSYNAPARSADGSDIERGAAVVISRIEGNVYYVQKRGKITRGRSL